MRRVLFFMMVTANGLYERGRWDSHPDGLDWHHTDAEFAEFAVQQLESVDTLVFGRVTYEGMASFWPTPSAMADDPVVARLMNALPKIVFSRTLGQAEWNNTRVIGGDIAEEMARLKQAPGKDMIVLGSSDLAVALANLSLIDEYRLLVNPIALGDGKPVFRGLTGDLPLRLHEARAFASGNVLLRYAPAAGASKGP